MKVMSQQRERGREWSAGRPRTALSHSLRGGVDYTRPGERTGQFCTTASLHAWKTTAGLAWRRTREAQKHEWKKPHVLTLFDAR